MIRTQEGQEIYDVVENMRQLSVKFHRDENLEARVELEELLDQLSPEEDVQVTRAFSYFSHFANLAEDQHHIWMDTNVRSYETQLPCQHRSLLEIESQKLPLFLA